MKPISRPFEKGDNKNEHRSTVSVDKYVKSNRQARSCKLIGVLQGPNTYRIPFTSVNSTYILSLLPSLFAGRDKGLKKMCHFRRNKLCGCNCSRSTGSCGIAYSPICGNSSGSLVKPRLKCINSLLLSGIRVAII